MILRKPYAFLIKHFKLIHAFICLLLIFVLTKSTSLLNFFSDYTVATSQIQSTNYVNFLVYFAIIIVIAISFTMIILMRKKDKPILFYILTIVAYSLVFIGFAYDNSVIATLEKSTLDRQTINLVRDINRFLVIGQYIILIPYIIRTLGFDIKKFDFKKDMKELDIEVSDNEEFEFTTGIDSEKVKTKLRRRIRELKYYYLENKIFILIIVIPILIITGYNLFSKININIKYKETDEIKLDNYYTLKITDSYITNKDNNNKEIKKDDTTFLILKFTVTSTYNGTFTLDTNKFIVKIKGNNYIPVKQYYKSLSNYGVGYKEQKIVANTTKDYILVYNIPNDYINKKMTLEYSYRYDYSSKNPKMIKKIVKLTPELVD